jgi:hypothetical protein
MGDIGSVRDERGLRFLLGVNPDFFGVDFFDFKPLFFGVNTFDEFISIDISL